MDVFSSALKNPLPPTRKKPDEENPEPAQSHPTFLDGPGLQYEQPPALIAAKTDQTSVLEPPMDSHEYLQDNKKKNSRRRHRNSHLGCGVCKKRRIKCDEHLPQCFNCIKGRLHCAYLNLDAPARNALRLAQYNQSLRDEREEDAAPKITEKSRNYNEFNNKPRPQPPKMMNTPGEQVPVRARNLTGENRHSRKSSSTVSHVPQHPMGPPGIPTQPSMMQSMYVPVIQLQPVNSGMPYSQVPMHMMPGQQPPQMMYLADHGHMQMPAQHMPGNPNGMSYMYYPPQPPGPPQPYDQGSSSYIMPMQRQYGYPGSFMPDSGHYYPQEPPKQEMISPPTINTLVPPAIPPPLLSVPRPLTSSNHSPVAYAQSVSTPNVPSSIHSGSHSANISGIKDLQISAPRLHLNPASLGPPPTGSLTADVSSNPAEPSVKLAPIQIPNGEKAHGSDKPSNPDNEKISSINMLLS